MSDFPYEFKDLIDAPALNAMLENLYQTAGIPSAIIDMKGNVLTGAGWQRICVDFHRRHPEALKSCIESDTHIRDEILAGNPFVVYECPHGLVDSCCPIIIEGEHLANVFTGQLLHQPPDRDMIERFRKQAVQLGFDESEYLKALMEVPVFSPAQHTAMLTFLSQLAKSVAEMGLTNLVARRHARNMMESEAKFRQYIDEAPVGVFITDNSGRYMEVNPAAEESTGYTQAELLERSIPDLVSEDSLPAALIAFEALLKTGHTKVETNFKKKDSSVGTWMVNAVKLTEDRFIAFTTDITEKKRAWERYAAVVDVAMDGFWAADKQGKLIEVNDAYCDMIGYSRAELLTMRIADLEAGESEEENAKHIARVISGGQDRFETKHRRKDGSIIDVEISAQYTVRAGGQFFVFIRDITEKKRAEEEHRKLEFQLRQSQKMEAVGTLAGGIAHDFNNILGAILGYADMALDTIDEENDAHECIGQVLKAGTRARDLIQHMLAFSRKSEASRSPVDLFRVIEDTTKLLRAAIPASVVIQKEMGIDKAVILADPTEIEQVLMNLGMNASQAMEDTGGVLTISLNEVSVENETHTGTAASLRPGIYFELRIRDTGTGIDPLIIERIFEPFFTTKSVNKGTGMGLSVVHGIVTHHQGGISLESTPGEGTCFTIHLPKMDATPEPVSEPATTHQGGTEHVLLIDDEEALMRVFRHQLQRLGYTVTALTDAKAALALFEKDPGAFDLVFTDQTMPGLNGDQLAAEIHRLRADIPIILCTGYSAKIDQLKPGINGIQAVIMKPVSRQELGVTVRNALDVSK